MNRFKELRQHRGLSQEQLAAAVNVVQTAVSKWERGKAFPDMPIAIRLADFFSVSVDYLLGRDVQIEKPATGEGDGLSDIQRRNIDLMKNLTAEEAIQVRAFVQGLKAARKD